MICVFGDFFSFFNICVCHLLLFTNNNNNRTCHLSMRTQFYLPLTHLIHVQNEPCLPVLPAAEHHCNFFYSNMRHFSSLTKVFFMWFPIYECLMASVRSPRYLDAHALLFELHEGYLLIVHKFTRCGCTWHGRSILMHKFLIVLSCSR